MFYHWIKWQKEAVPVNTQEKFLVVETEDPPIVSPEMKVMIYNRVPYFTPDFYFTKKERKHNWKKKSYFGKTY